MGEVVCDIELAAGLDEMIELLIHLMEHHAQLAQMLDEEVLRFGDAA